MKKTKYIVSEQHTASNLHLAVKTAEARRDEFINESINIIGTIESENLQVIRPTQYNSSVQVIITLTYYLKDEA